MWILKLFRASDNVVPIQPGDRSNVEVTSYFIAVFTLHKMFKSIARYVNAAIKQNRDKVGIAYTSGGFETLLCHWYDTMIITLL